jgi:3D (Asp-Asp-Asp) domain-containing protein
MLIARSLWRKLLATLVVLVGFVWVYEATMLDSRFAMHNLAPIDPNRPRPGVRLRFGATAYCKGKTTASGVNVRSGIAAADPDLLPVGSVIQVNAPRQRYDGIYTIMDTGPRVQGRRLDLYMWSCYEALDFGYTRVDISVLRLGWSPQASEPTLIDRLFRRREAAKRSQAAAEPPTQIPPSTLPTPEPEVAAASVPSEPGAASDPGSPLTTATPDETPPPPSDPNRSRSEDGSPSSPSR